MSKLLETIRRNQQRMLMVIEITKALRPPCPYNEDGKHVMIEYQDEGVKICHDCGHTENIIIKW